MFIETAEGVIELKDDGTYIRHRTRYHNVGGKMFKEDLDTKGILPVSASVLLTVDSTTGEICCEQRGFVLDHEFRAPVHPAAGKEYLKLLEAEIPGDFKSGTSDINYRIVAGKLVRKPQMLGAV